MSSDGPPRPTNSNPAPPVSIAPPSDIVLDVAQAADPARVQAAAAKLASLAGAPAADIDFAAVLQARSRPIATPPAPMASSPVKLPYERGHQLDARVGSPYQKFEAVVLQNFMQSILPKDSDLFGDAFSADAYRSMLAEQLAMQVAKSGRLGIAQLIEHREAAKHGRPDAAQPSASPAAALDAPKTSSS